MKPDWKNKPEDMEVWIEDLDGCVGSCWHKSGERNGKPAWVDERNNFWYKSSDSIEVHYPPTEHNSFAEGDTVQTSVGKGVIKTFVEQDDKESAIVQLEDTWASIPVEHLMRPDTLKDEFYEHLTEFSDSHIAGWFVENATKEQMEAFLEENSDD